MECSLIFQKYFFRLFWVQIKICFRMKVETITFNRLMTHESNCLRIIWDLCNITFENSKQLRCIYGCCICPPSWIICDIMGIFVLSRHLISSSRWLLSWKILIISVLLFLAKMKHCSATYFLENSLNNLIVKVICIMSAESEQNILLLPLTRAVETYLTFVM